MFLCEFVLGLSLGVASLLKQAGNAEVVPPGREPPRIMMVRSPAPIHPFFNADPYWRMRLYRPDRYGYLRPRVIYGPAGAYYPLTGKPYPYTPVKGIP